MYSDSLDFGSHRQEFSRGLSNLSVVSSAEDFGWVVVVGQSSMSGLQLFLFGDLVCI